MIYKQFIKNYWHYYLQLEGQVLNTQRYVDFSSRNNGVYSIEYLQLFLSICSEIDVLAKEIVLNNNPKLKLKDIKTIRTWGIEIDEIVDNIQEKKVFFNDDYIVQPWEKWYHEKFIDNNGKKKGKLKDGCKNPSWWNEYNKVKPERTIMNFSKKCKYYTRANLKNVVLSLGVLYILEISFMNILAIDESINIDEDICSSRLFKRKY